MGTASPAPAAPTNLLSRLWTRLNDGKDVAMATYIAVLLLLGEAVLCGLIIWKVPYTEIDWVAYMQEVQGFLQGELDYTHLKGETGPLVYPAGFVYIYSALHWLTRGGDIFPGQLVFALVYLATQAVVFYIYIRSRTFPPWALALLCLSKRMHSLYVLRLFNDCIAMLLAYIAIALLVERRWRLALLSFSAAVSVKMNVLLMAPPVLVVMLKDAKLGDIIKGTIAGTVLQLLLGAPFLWHSPMSYLSRAFELSRVFQHVWSVNLKFLPVDIFQSKALAIGLLAAHLAVLGLFAHFRWCKAEGGLGGLLSKALSAGAQQGVSSQPGTRSAKQRPPLSASQILLIVFTGNFIGIVFARTLHYQFYSWYFHMLPFLLWQVDLPNMARVLLWFCIEVLWNIYPSTSSSSLAVWECHLALLLSLWKWPVQHSAVAGSTDDCAKVQ